MTDPDAAAMVIEIRDDGIRLGQFLKLANLIDSATQGILVNAITPAVAKTAMFDQMTQAHIDYMLGKIPMGRFLEVQELAAMAAWLASEECSFSTGAVFDLTGGRATY